MKSLLIVLIATILSLVFFCKPSHAIDNVLSQDVVKNFVINSGFENGLAPHQATNTTTATATVGLLPYAIVTTPVHSGNKALHFVSSDTASMTLSLFTDNLPVGDNFDTYFYYQSTATSTVQVKTISNSLVTTITLNPCLTYCKSQVTSVAGGNKYKFFFVGINDIYIDDVRSEKSGNSTVGSISAAYPITSSNIGGIVTIGLTGNITTTATASQALTTDSNKVITGSGVYDYELTSLSGILTNAVKNRIFYVAVGGSDTDCSSSVKFNCGDGSVLRPFLTINHTITKIPAPNDQDHHYVISLGAGRFIETADILLPPYVDLIGQSRRATYVRVNSANNCIGPNSLWATNSSWTTLKGFYAGGTTKFCFDLQALGGSNANLTLHDLWANSDNTFKGRNAGGGDFIEAYDTLFGAGGGTTTINQFLPQWQQGIFAGPVVVTNSQGSSSGNFINCNFGANVTLGGPYASTLQLSNSPFASAGITLTATGTMSLYTDAVSLPPLGNQVLGPLVTFTCLGNIACNGSGGGGGGTVGGSGTVNRVAKWSNTSSITNASITDDGTTVTAASVDLGINTGKYLYLGSSTVDNSLRLSNRTGVLIIEKRISGTWTELAHIDEL